jgi:hypothetical protein
MQSVNPGGVKAMKEEAKHLLEKLDRKTRTARRWLRALISLLDDLMVVTLAGFIGAGHGLVTVRTRKNGR